MRGRTIVIKLPDRLAQRVARAAKAEGVTTSFVVRRALEHDLSDPTDPVDDIKDLIGSADGPSDLASNDKYLEGYGK